MKDLGKGESGAGAESVKCRRPTWTVETPRGAGLGRRRQHPHRAPVARAVPGVECVHNGRRLANGDTWKPDPCHLCICNNGTALCEEMTCKDSINCPGAEIPDGECCPQCPDGPGRVQSRPRGLREAGSLRTTGEPASDCAPPALSPESALDLVNSGVQVPPAPLVPSRARLVLPPSLTTLLSSRPTL